MEENQLLLTMPERNIVILGKVGTGKRTLGNHIVGQDIFQQESLFDAGNANHHYKQQWAGGTFYRILTVDIESLQTSYCNPLPYIRHHLQTVHLIIFVIANGRYTDESHNALMRAVQDLHPQAKPFSALVITHCEGITEESRRDIVNEFKVNSRSSEVAAFIGKQIFAVGLPDISKVSTHFKSIYQNGITEDEIVIRGLVKNCDHPLSVQDLPDVQSNFRYGLESFCNRLRRCRESFCDRMSRCWESFCDRISRCWESFCDRMSRYWESFCDRLRRCWESFRDCVRSCHCPKCCLLGISIVLFPLVWLYRYLHYSSL